MPVKYTRPNRSDDRARLILEIIGHERPPDNLLRRAQLFVEVNGFDQVLGAARHTAYRRATEGIDRPWSYLRESVNTNTARLSHLYTLVHWAEVSLRSAIDLAYACDHGARWHLLPVYLPESQIEGLRNDPAHKRTIKWRFDRAANRHVPDYESPEAFLGSLTLGVLRSIALYAETPEHKGAAPRLTRPLLWDSSGNRLPFQSTTKLLRLLVKVRNEMAHNRPLEHRDEGRLWLGGHAYVEDVLPGIEELLTALRFDLLKVHERFSERQAHVLLDARARHGGVDPRAAA